MEFVAGKLVIFLCLLHYTIAGNDVEFNITSNCIDVAYCNLMKGDIARESDKYGIDPSKYYKDAEINTDKYIQYNKSNDETLQKECQAEYEKCSDEVRQMAVTGLGYPSEYQNICRFQSYSRHIFGCKNMKQWPEKVKTSMPIEDKDCADECVMDANKTYTLNNGKILHNSEEGPEFIDENDILPEVNLVKSFGLNSLTLVLKYMNGYGDISGGWNTRDACPFSYWANTVYNLKPDERVNSLLYHVAFVCKNPYFNIQNNRFQITSGRARPIHGYDYNTPKTIVTPGYTYDITIGKYCTGKPVVGLNNRPGVIIGVSLRSEQYKTYGRVLRYINYLCGNTPHWNIIADSDREPGATMICDNFQAICSLETKTAIYEGQGFITNVRIGCCKGDPFNIDLFTQLPNLIVPTRGTTTTTTATTTTTTTKRPSETTTTKPGQSTATTTTLKPEPPLTTPTGKPEPPGKDNLYKFQTSYFLFWGQILSEVITRYNYYYAPNHIVNESEWTTTLCPTGTFINAYEIKDPCSSYFLGRRIMQISFKCGAPDGSKSSDLDIYNSFKTGYTLQAPSLLKMSECKNGYYMSMKLDYYSDNPRSILVNAWGFGMKCSVSINFEGHSHLINSSPRNNISENTVQSAQVDCEIGKAICGFVNKISHNRIGVFEGLYFKVICCQVV